MTETQPQGDARARDIAENKDLAAFSYVWVMSVIVYILKKDSPFIRHHSKQSMILCLLSVVVWFIPILGQLLELLILCAMVYGFVVAAQGLYKDVPIVGPLSRGEITLRQAWKEAVEAVAHLARSARDLANDKPEENAQKPSAGTTPMDEASNNSHTNDSLGPHS